MDNIEQLLTDIKESLEREMQGLRREMKGLHQRFDEVNARFDNQAIRLDRHAALLQVGSRWTGRINEWAEKVDSAMDVKDRQVADLSERVRKLENGSNGPANP